MLNKLLLKTSGKNTIKLLKPKDKARGGKYFQGYYDKEKCKKYVGIDTIIYRSSLEYKFIQWCEKNDKILHWSSECGYITYPYNNEIHRYFIDFVFEDVNGTIFYVEIKPYSIVLESKNNSFNKNYQKWLAMKTICNENKGHVFKIITEKFFK